MAIINDEEKARYKTVKGIASVDPKSGANNFVPDCEGSHAYVVKEKAMVGMLIKQMNCYNKSC